VKRTEEEGDFIHVLLKCDRCMHVHNFFCKKEDYPIIRAEDDFNYCIKCGERI